MISISYPASRIGIRDIVGWPLLTLAIVASLCGCMGYRLGTSLPPHMRSIYIPTFVNRTREPNLESATTQATVLEFQTDGTLRVTDKMKADLLLAVVLTGYELKPVSYEEENRKSIAEYRLLITVEMTLSESGSGKTLFEKKLTGDSYVQVGNDLAGSKVVALPSAARDLAHDIVESVVDYWP